MQDPQPRPDPAPQETDGPRNPSQAGKDAQAQSPANGSAETRDQQRGPTRLIARYGRTFQIGQFRHNLSSAPNPGKKVVVRTERGVELAEVIAPIGGPSPFAIQPERLDEYLQANGKEYPFHRNGRVLRAANNQDIIDQRHLDSSASEEYRFCRNLIRELNLEMKLIAVEHLLGGERIIFYFTAEHRVDFRELVRRLAGQYRTRIEMRQVGARDEARLVADLERCGRRCCCRQFLKELKPVSMRMAKVQKATLDPTKISGRCGRLMCCLRYEDKTYEQLRRTLPKKNNWVRTETVTGRVIASQIITQLVRLALPDGSVLAVGNEEIVERNLPAPANAEETAKLAAENAANLRRAKDKDQDSLDQALEKVSLGKEAKDEVDQQERKESGDNAGKSRSRKRRRRKRKKGDGAKANASRGRKQGDKSQGGKSSAGGGSQKKRRRPRRRRKKPGSEGSGQGKGSSGGPSSGKG
jgi:cell fate regulator YaaT (PSP1 superfamily)